MLSACGYSAAFNTHLTSADALASGAPVTHEGAVIGQVTAVTPLPASGAEVAFEVGSPDFELVHQDSIMVLREGPAPSLELVTPNLVSPAALSGSTITGATNDVEAMNLIASRNQAALAGVAGTLGALNQTLQGVGSSTAAYQFQSELLALEVAAAANGGRGLALSPQDWDRINHDYAALEGELVREGKTAEAERLRQNFEYFTRTVGAAGTGTSTLTIPPAVPTP